MEAFVVTGREAILARSEQLEELALRCGQPGAMHGLRLLLGSRFAIRKRSSLVYFSNVPPSQDSDQPLQSAVLLLEYCIAGMGTGLFATADSFGVRTVIAPAHLRVSTASTAIQTMLKRGARIVLVTLKPTANVIEAYSAAHASQPYLYAMMRRMVQDTLMLCSSLEETLATLGKRTRIHMRAARRRFDKTFPHAVLVDALPALDSYNAEDLRRLNETSLDPIEQSDFDHQVRSVCGANSFALGLRDGQRWMAIIAGWRQGNKVFIEWQINSAGYEKLSLGSVLRSYLLEHEAARGMHRVSFHGGTSHSMVHSFVQDEVIDLVGRRPGFIGALTVALARKLYSLFPRLRERGNFLLDVLAVDDLVWSKHIENESVSNRV